MITPFIRRLKSTSVSTNVGTKQVVYTVPAGKQVVVTDIALRDASGSLVTISGTLAFGFNSGADDFSISFSQAELQSIISSSLFIKKPTSGASLVGTAGQTFGGIFSSTALTRTLTIDIFGYLISV